MVDNLPTSVRKALRLMTNEHQYEERIDFLMDLTVGELRLHIFSASASQATGRVLLPLRTFSKIPSLKDTKPA